MSSGIKVVGCSKQTSPPYHARRVGHAARPGGLLRSSHGSQNSTTATAVPLTHKD